jgi:alpha-galactosidase
MPKIAFIGAGSFGFTRGLVRDILTFPALADSTLALMDIDQERLDFATKAVNKIVEAGKYPAKVVSTLDRAEALDGADGVLITILQGGVEVFRGDIEIPMKYGVDTNIGDTRSVSGIFRALRTIPVIWTSTARTRSSSTTRTRWRCSAARCRASFRSWLSPASATAFRARP